MKILAAATTYFGCVFGAGFVLGMIRVPFVVPQLGVRAAELVEMPLMVGVIVLAARFIHRRFDRPTSIAHRLSIGVIALLLMIAAELSLALVTGQQSIGAYVAGRDPVSGTVYLAVLLLFALMPVLIGGVKQKSHADPIAAPRVRR